MAGQSNLCLLIEADKFLYFCFPSSLSSHGPSCVPCPTSSPSEQARVGPNGKRTFLIIGPLTDFLLSNVNPEQWKTNSSRKLEAMNYRIPNKYEWRKLSSHSLKGRGWLGMDDSCAFFPQGTWALFIYIVLCLRVLPWRNSWLDSDNFSAYFHPAVFQCSCASCWY